MSSTYPDEKEGNSMSLKAKTFLIIAVPLIVFLAILYLAVSDVVSERFAEIEIRNAGVHAERVAGAIKGEALGLSRVAADWGRWDATYGFVAGENSEFKKDLVFESFSDLRINLLAIVDRRGNALFSRIYELETQAERTPPPELVGRIPVDSPIMQGANEPVSGLLRTSEGLMLVGINPILTTEGKGPSRGLIMMGRFLNEDSLGIIKEVVNAPFDLLPLGYKGIPPGWAVPVHELENGKVYSVERESETELVAYVLMNDISDRPALVVRAITSSDITAGARTLVRYMALFMLGTGVIMIILTQLILQRFVIEPIGKLVRSASDIGHDSDLSLRIPESGSDEISRLARSVNGMLARLEKASDDIARVQKAREDFTSIVSHELRAPLATIKEGVGLISDGADGPITDAQRSTLEIVQRNVDRMARLIVNVLDISRIESGKLSISLEMIDMKRLASDAFELMRPVAGRKGIELRLSLPDEDLFAKCDPERIKQVLVNLVDNAIKFTDSGTVDISLSTGADLVRFEVSDSGIGIGASDVGHIFERFRQGSNQGRRRHGGTGLGLSICKHIVERHGGSISVFSEEGRGSRFVVELPMDPPEPSGCN